MRIWLEDGTAPERSRDLTIAHGAVVVGLAGVWIYQGLVPKLWKADGQEVALWQQSFGIGEGAARSVVRIVGVGEIAVGIAVGCSKRRWPLVATVAAMPVLALGAARADRRLFARAFNPASLNWATAALAIAALATNEGRPSAAKPLRSAPDVQPDVDELP